jgi:hypothetical protein
LQRNRHSDTLPDKPKGIAAQSKAKKGNIFGNPHPFLAIFLSDLKSLAALTVLVASRGDEDLRENVAVNEKMLP